MLIQASSECSFDLMDILEWKLDTYREVALRVKKPSHVRYLCATIFSVISDWMFSENYAEIDMIVRYELRSLAAGIATLLAIPSPKAAQEAIARLQDFSDVYKKRHESWSASVRIWREERQNQLNQVV